LSRILLISTLSDDLIEVFSGSPKYFGFFQPPAGALLGDFFDLTQLSQLGIEIGTFDTARVVSFHHKAYLFN